MKRFNNEFFLDSMMEEKKFDCKAAAFGASDLSEFATHCTPMKWSAFFKDSQVQDILRQLSTKLPQGSQPPMPMVFRAFNFFAPKDIKVVILSQDPTPQLGKATGLAFSVPDPRKVPSVLNVLLEVALVGWKVDISNGDLSAWARQGVLLLNMALTIHPAGTSQVTHWKMFTEFLIRFISLKAPPSASILWGQKAKRLVTQDFIHEKHYIITGSHPSPVGGAALNFFGGAYFICANEFLTDTRNVFIDWSLAAQNVMNQCPKIPGSKKGKRKRKRPEGDYSRKASGWTF